MRTSAFKNKYVRRSLPIVVTLAVAAVGMTAVAQSDRGGAPEQQDCAKDYQDAANAAMRTHVAITEAFYSRANESMQAAVSSGSSSGNTASGVLASCLDKLVDFDLSMLIPDFSFVGALIQKAVDRMVNKAMNRVCNSVRNATHTAIGSWNDAVGDINAQFNLNKRVLGAVNNYGVGPINNAGRPYDLTGGGITGSGLTGGQPICIQTVTGRTCTDGTNVVVPPTGGAIPGPGGTGTGLPGDTGPGGPAPGPGGPVGPPPVAPPTNSLIPRS